MLMGLARSLPAFGHQAVLGVFRNSRRLHTEIAEIAHREGLAVEVIPCDGRADWTAVRAIERCIDTHAIDVVHTHGYKADLYGYAGAKRRDVPLIATYHIDWPDRGVALRLYHVLDRVVVGRFGRVVAVSEAIATSLRRFGAPRRKITTIDNGIDLAPFEGAQPTLREELRGRRGKIVGLVGRLTPQKGADCFLHAARDVLADCPDTLFVLVGEGPQRQSLEAVVRRLDIADRVIFAGHRADMPGVYASLDVLVLPSINEGLPMTLIEAMASARPVVATPVGAVPKLITSERTGLLVNPGDACGLSAAIVRMLSDASLRERLGAQGKEWVTRHFSARAMARQYAEQYCELIDEALTARTAAGAIESDPPRSSH